MIEHYEIPRSNVYQKIYVVLSIIDMGFVSRLTVKMMFSVAAINGVYVSLVMILFPIVCLFSVLGIRYLLGIRNKVNITVDGDKITFYSGMTKRTHYFWDIKKTEYLRKYNPHPEYTYGLYLCFSPFERYGIFVDDVNGERLLSRLEKMGLVRKTAYFYEPVKK